MMRNKDWCKDFRCIVGLFRSLGVFSVQLGYVRSTLRRTFPISISVACFFFFGMNLLIYISTAILVYSTV